MTQEPATINGVSTSDTGLVTTRSSDGLAMAGGVGGTTKIADSVVARIAALAAREVPGVHDLASTGIGSTFGNIANRVTGQDQTEKGVGVQVGDIECIVDLSIVVDYGASIPQMAVALRRNISGRIRAMTGLDTKEVNINVTDLSFPTQVPSPQQPAVQ